MKVRTKERSFPTQLISEEMINHERLTREEKLTIATDPQQRPILLPATERTALDKPVCGSVVMGVACSVVVDGRIWRGEP